MSFHKLHKANTALYSADNQYHHYVKQHLGLCNRINMNSDGYDTGVLVSACASETYTELD